MGPLMPAYETSAPIAASVDVPSGRIRVTATERTDTVVEVRPSNELSDKDVQAAEETQVEYVRGRLTVRAPKSWLRSLIGPTASIDVDIALPAGSALTVSTWGDCTCEGRLGDVAVESAAGSLRIEHAAGLRAKTAAGDIAVGRIDGRGDVDAAVGAVWMDEVAGPTVAKVSSGGVTVGEVTADLRLHGAYGDIRVDRVLATVGAKTAYGSVRVGEAVRSAIVLDTGHGDLEVGIAAGTAAWLDVSSKYGVVRSALDATGEPPADGETVEIRARTQYGDVIVRRA
ncbi:MAG: DUF4097 family beta strand repeat protein [Streptosporangiales bacterium]|nr:DUF4097 family beta strand repeat protein [Streptosporangiales bacterium]